MNEHAKMIERLDDALEQNKESQRKLWVECSSYDEYGELELTQKGAKLMQQLVAERRELEESANAAFRIR